MKLQPQESSLRFPSCIVDMGVFLREQPPALTEYDEPLARRLVEKVTVYSGRQAAADEFTVELKSVVTVDRFIIYVDLACSRVIIR